MTRHAVLRKNVKKNQIFKYNDVLFLRTGSKGISLNQIENYNNKFYNNNFKKNVLLKKEFFYKK